MSDKFMDKFLIIAVTSPVPYLNEPQKINRILADDEVDFVHIRKPDSSVTEIEDLIRNIDPEYHNQLKLHDHFELIEKFDLGGIHLNSRNKISVPGAKSISISFHSMKEIDNISDYDYFFISPVFDSISKLEYKSKFNLEKLSTEIKGKRAVALGGVTPEKIPLLKNAGFYGAAMLGHFFPQIINI